MFSPGAPSGGSQGSGGGFIYNNGGPGGGGSMLVHAAPTLDDPKGPWLGGPSAGLFTNPNPLASMAQHLPTVDTEGKAGTSKQ